LFEVELCTFLKCLLVMFAKEEKASKQWDGRDSKAKAWSA
jgi:hypothetical protein